MSKEDHNQNGNFNDRRELALVEEIMRTIEQYGKDKQANLRPACLRDTMLAIAALLHLEAARVDSEDADRPRPRTKQLSDALAKAARTALEDVSSARAARFSSGGKN